MQATRRHSRSQLLEQLKSLPDELSTGRDRHSREIAAGPGQARHNAFGDGIGVEQEDSRDCSCRLLCGFAQPPRSAHRDHVHAVSDEFGENGRRALRLPLR